jgi:serine/threonine-protein kinase
MQIRCPHCNHPVEVIDENLLDDVTCPSCGSIISLVSKDTTVGHAPLASANADNSATADSDNSTSRDRSIPSKIRHFELLEQVGAGAFGVVWRARDTRLGRIVAIKFPRRERLDEAESRRFLQEARMVAKLKHPNIVGVYEVGDENGSVYLVSDFIDGVSLDKYLHDQRPTHRRAAELCQKICAALHYAHEA